MWTYVPEEKKPTLNVWVERGQKVNDHTRFRDDDRSLGWFGRIGTFRRVVPQRRYLGFSTNVRSSDRSMSGRKTHLGCRVDICRIPLGLIPEIDLAYLVVCSARFDCDPSTMSVRTALLERSSIDVV